MNWKEVAFFVALLVVWFGLNRWVFPRCGITTCCTPHSCGVAPLQTVEQPSVLPNESLEPKADVERQGEMHDDD